MKFIRSKNLAIFIYSLALILLWGMCFRAYEATQISCGIGLILTYISAFFMQEQYDLTLKNKLTILILPLAYSIIFFIKDDFPFVFTPFFIALIFLVLNFFVFKDLRRLINHIVFVLVTLGSVQYLFPAYKTKIWNLNTVESVQINKPVEQAENRLETGFDEINLSEFNFLITKGTETKIQSDKPFIFIQTMEENCVPCKKALKQLSPTLDSMNQDLESFYIYHNNRFELEQFQKFVKKDKNLIGKNILADEESAFFDQFNISADPTFLIINNQTGEVIFKSVGFGSKHKVLLTEKLKEISAAN